MWKAGLVQAQDQPAYGTARSNSSPVPSIAMSARSNISSMSRLTEGRRSKLEALLLNEDNKPKQRVRQRRRPRVSSNIDLRKAALHKSGRNHVAARQRRQTKSTEPITRTRNNRNQGAATSSSYASSSIANENDNDVDAAPNNAAKSRGVTVVLPEAVFFNGMNCIERPHWSVVDVGRAANGEDQTMSISMWLSPSASLRLKKTDGQRANAARMKSNLAQQALQGKEELHVAPGGGSMNGKNTGDWYVVLNRQRSNNPQVDPIDRMLGNEDQLQRQDQPNQHNHTAPPTLDTLAQHQLDAAILGADFSISGMSTPQISLNGADGRLSVRAQYRSTASNSSVPILEKSLFSNGSCAFGKWTHVVVVISGASVRIYLDGELDSQMYLNGPIHMPQEASMYVGRNEPVKNQNSNNSNNNDLAAPTLGFVGFLAHVIVHGRAIDKLGVQAMASAPRPALPREQDEWSALSNYDAMRDKNQKVTDRKKKYNQMKNNRLELDAQVEYNRQMKIREKEEEKLADHRHLSKYGAMADQLKTETYNIQKMKKEKAKQEMDAQKAVEDVKNRNDQERRMAEEIHEVRLLQQKVQKYQTENEILKTKNQKQAIREAKDYKRLAHEKQLQKTARYTQKLREKEAAEQTAREYRQQETARETQKRKEMREYKAALDRQVDRKHAGNSSKTHLSPTERSMNARMLAKMSRMDLTAGGEGSGSQWGGSQYSMSYGGGGGTHKAPGSQYGGSLSPNAPGWKGASGSRYNKSSSVSRQEILDLLDNDMMI